MAVSSIKLINTVNQVAIMRLNNQLLFSMMNCDLLKADIKLLKPLVAKYIVDKKPKESNLPLRCFTKSSKVVWKAT